MGFGMEILFVLVLGLLVLGPKRLHTILGHVAQAKAELENAARGLKSQLAAELDATHQEKTIELRRNRVGIREPSSDPRYRNSEPTADSGVEFHATGYQDPEAHC